MNFVEKFILGIGILVVFIAPIGLAVFYTLDRAEILLNSDRQSAIIQDCKREYVNRNLSSRRKSKSGSFYRAVAKAEDGSVIKANLALASKSFCRKNIGKPVTVFVHRKDETRSRLNSFLQFWLIPLSMIVVASVLNWALIDGFRKGYWKLK